MSDMLPIVFWHVSWAGGTKVDRVVVKVGRERLKGESPPVMHATDIHVYGLADSRHAGIFYLQACMRIPHA